MDYPEGTIGFQLSDSLRMTTEAAEWPSLTGCLNTGIVNISRASIPVVPFDQRVQTSNPAWYNRLPGARLETGIDRKQPASPYVVHLNS
ncbi:MAG: hypothetical protein IPJ06_19875 [Saprospiraceae bacterium]|nr:hypothetical protein [Saprospiraceae bacterium]